MPVDHHTRAENVQFMADTGENAIGAARRLGLSYAGLEKWAKTHTPDAWATLLARNPRDANAKSAGRNQYTAA